jgi:DNA invertase Pin-like site-specific DNA recombinase
LAAGRRSRLLAEARRTQPVVVVARLDRLFRSVADAAQIICEFDRYGIDLVAIAEGLDMTNPYGRAMAQMASVFAELERAMIRERTKGDEGEARQEGADQRTCTIRLGFRAGRQAVRERQGTEGRCLDSEAAQARRVPARHRQALNDRGIEPKRATRWLHGSVLRIMKRAA